MFSWMEASLGDIQRFAWRHIEDTIETTLPAMFHEKAQQIFPSIDPLL